MPLLLHRLALFNKLLGETQDLSFEGFDFQDCFFFFLFSFFRVLKSREVWCVRVELPSANCYAYLSLCVPNCQVPTCSAALGGGSVEIL